MRISIIGGGIAGLTAAIGFLKIGIQVQIFESSPELKGIGAGLGLAANAMQGFDYLGIKEDILSLGHQLPSYAIQDEYGKLLVATNTKKLSHRYEQDNFAIHRADLHQYLVSQITQQNLYLGKKAIRFEESSSGVRLFFADGTDYESDYVIVADGIHSPLRQQLIPESKPRYAGYTCWRAIISDSSIQLTEGSETWGSKGRFGMTPLVGNKIFWYACVNASAKDNRYRNFKRADIYQNFKNYHDPIPQIIAETAEEAILWNDIIDLKPLKHFAYGRLLLIGDAAHATTPNMGQGACQAIEDVVILMEEVQAHTDMALAFQGFEKRRLARTKYITETSALIGKVAQWDNPFLIRIRNYLFRNLPDSITQRNLNKLFEVDFMKI